MKPLAVPILAGLFLSGLAHANNDLVIGERTLTLGEQKTVEPTFRDQHGREIHLRGWNVSGSVKLASRGFKPFASREDAARAFELMKRHTGANLVRFTMSWEGTHPAPDQIDYVYLDALIEQMREAFKQGIYVFLDYHTDLYSRHVFQLDSKHTGNGAPEWIIRGGSYPPSNCGVICFAWSQHNVLDPAVRLGYRNFFDNARIDTVAGERHVQDEFLWQMRQVLHYVKGKLTAEEFDWITGVQPINEPIYGLGHRNRAAEFDNQKLWPFYHRTRAIMNDTGWQNKWVYAEPMVFWDTNAGFFAPPTGGHYLKEKPGKGYVFAPHFYDAARMGVTNTNKVYNGEYFRNLDTIREEARFLGIPTVLGEFGMWLKDQKGGARDHARIVKGTYQAMEISDRDKAVKDRRPDFYTAAISGTQWHWDINKDNHYEYQNGNPRKLKTKGDGWNGEDFSVIKGDTLTVDANTVQRAWPRAIDGNLVSFHYNDLAVDGKGQRLQWAEILAGDHALFGEQKFLLLIWQGGNRQVTEVFLPTSFTPETTTLITDTEVTASLANDPRMQPEFDSGLTGYRLLLPSHAGSQPDDLHFALIVDESSESRSTLESLQAALIGQITRHEHPVFLRGRMAGLNYPHDTGQTGKIQLTASEQHFLFLRSVTLAWQGESSVNVLQKDKRVLQGAAKGSATRLSFVGVKDTFKVCEQANPALCSRELQFD